MKSHRSARVRALIVIFLIAAAAIPAQAANACFAAAKVYQIHPVHGGADIKNGWSVRGDAFNQCVRKAEAADKSLRARYPETVYALSLASTIGCHAC
jgi:hypothetical protein